MTTSVENVTDTAGFSAGECRYPLRLEDQLREEETLRLEVEYADSVAAAIKRIGTLRIKNEFSYVFGLAEDEEIVGIDALNGPRNMAVSCATRSKREGLAIRWRFIDGAHRPGWEGAPRLSEPVISLMGKQAILNAREARSMPTDQRHGLLFRLAATEIHFAED